MKDSEAKNLIGCCGLYCGLCNKYQSTAPSRCVGCQLGEQHAWCSIWVCCAKKHGLITCTECEEIFDCPIFVRRKVSEWVPAALNLHRITEIGTENWLREQIDRQSLLEGLLQDFNEGRSMSLFCKVCVRMPVDLICEGVEKAKEILARDKVDPADKKSRAKVFKSVIEDFAAEGSIDLK